MKKLYQLKYYYYFNFFYNTLYSFKNYLLLFNDTSKIIQNYVSKTVKEK